MTSEFCWWLQVVHEHLLENKKLFYRFNTVMMDKKKAEKKSVGASIMPQLQSIRGCEATSVIGHEVNAMQRSVLSLRQKVRRERSCLL